MEFLIVDSLSHAWTGEGGLLDVQAKASQRTGNSYTAWREVTPWHNKLVDKILQCNMHVAVTLRTKAEYVIEENEKGKKAPRKIGMAPIFREGIEYETTMFFELSQDHTACATKDRTGIFDSLYFVISPESGVKIHDWLSQSKSVDTTTEVQRPKAGKAKTEDEPAPEPFSDTPPEADLSEAVDAAIRRYCEGMDTKEKQVVAEEIREITGGISNYRSVKDPVILEKLLNRFAKENEGE